MNVDTPPPAFIRLSLFYLCIVGLYTEDTWLCSLCLSESRYIPSAAEIWHGPCLLQGKILFSAFYGAFAAVPSGSTPVANTDSSAADDHAMPFTSDSATSFT